MKTALRRKINSLVSLLSFIALLFCGSGCSLVRQSMAALSSTDRFIADAKDNRVLLEPGAEAYADKVASLLPSAIGQVETRQYRQFVAPVHVYVCASRESIRKFYGDASAGVLTKLFVSPRMLDQGDEIRRKYLTHELSHLHWLQQLGISKTNRLPMWFKEGLAAYVSDGGGAHLASEEQALLFIREGKHFVPNDGNGLFSKKTPSDFGLEPHMFYRQSMMFIRYLASRNEARFKRFLISMEDGERLPKALQAEYNRKLELLWDDFLHETNGRSSPTARFAGQFAGPVEQTETRQMSGFGKKALSGLQPV